MASKVFAGLVVAFWLTMMVALVRLEFYPKAAPLGEVSPDRVLQKVFANREPARLNVYYQKAPIGFCKVEIVPLAGRDSGPMDTIKGDPKAFLVQTDLDMKLLFFGTPSRFHLVGSTRLTPRYEVIAFRVKTSIGEGRVDVQGDDKSKKVNVQVDLGEKRETRQFDFDSLRTGGLSSMIGIPGLANFGLPASGAFPGSGLGQSTPLSVRVAQDRFVFGEISQRAYLIALRTADSMWAKIWVSDSGEVLFVDSSTGMTMVSDLIDSMDGSSRAKMTMRHLRSKGRRAHDSN
jgi:hypothetical protein